MSLGKIGASIHSDMRPMRAALPAATRASNQAFAGLLDVDDPLHQSHARSFLETGLIAAIPGNSAPDAPKDGASDGPEGAILNAPAPHPPRTISAASAPSIEADAPLALTSGDYISALSCSSNGADQYGAPGASLTSRERFAGAVKSAIAVPSYASLKIEPAFGPAAAPKTTLAIKPKLGAPAPLMPRPRPPKSSLLSVKLINGVLHAALPANGLSTHEARAFRDAAQDVIRGAGFSQSALRLLGASTRKQGYRHG